MTDQCNWGGDPPSAEPVLDNHSPRESGGVLAVQPEQSLEPIPGELTATSYRPPEDLSFERWASIGAALQQMERSVQFWLGDWWAFGERKFGEDAAQGLRDQIEQATGRRMQTIYDYGWVSRAVPPSSRKEALTFDHHRSVAKLAAEHPQEAAEMLEKAAAEPRHWSAAELKGEAQRVERELALARPAPPDAALPADVRIEVADATAMPLADGLVDLIVTSPPDAPAEGWRDFMARFAVEAYRVTKEHGRLALVVPLDSTGGGFRPAYAQAVDAAVEAGWKYRFTIDWNEGGVSKSSGRGSLDSPQAVHVVTPNQMIAVFSKGEWRRDPTGRTWDLGHHEWLAWTNGAWSFPGEPDPWEGHPATFPLELPRRLIRLLSFYGDLVCDPFCGTSTTGIAALRLGRRYIGFDISPEYVGSSRRRLLAAGFTTDSDQAVAS